MTHIRINHDNTPDMMDTYDTRLGTDVNCNRPAHPFRCLLLASLNAPEPKQPLLTARPYAPILLNTIPVQWTLPFKSNSVTNGTSQPGHSTRIYTETINYSHVALDSNGSCLMIEMVVYSLVLTLATGPLNTLSPLWSPPGTIAFSSLRQSPRCFFL